MDDASRVEVVLPLGSGDRRRAIFGAMGKMMPPMMNILGVALYDDVVQ